jgi:dTDP-4-dehydrorhamnose 3,5-epimerase
VSGTYQTLAEARRSRPFAQAATIVGLELLTLPVERDDRGSLAEVCRNSWVEPEHPIQWNAVRNRPGALRGVHWHNRHADYLAAVFGRVIVAAVDLRVGSPTERTVMLVELDADEPSGLFVPTGVGHGFYARGESVLMYGVSAYWDPADELGVRWHDPALGIDWPLDPEGVAIVSERDAAFPLLADAGPLPRWSGETA